MVKSNEFTALVLDDEKESRNVFEILLENYDDIKVQKHY